MSNYGAVSLLKDMVNDWDTISAGGPLSGIALADLPDITATLCVISKLTVYAIGRISVFNGGLHVGDVFTRPGQPVGMEVVSHDATRQSVIVKFLTAGESSDTRSISVPALMALVDGCDWVRVPKKENGG